VKGIGGHGAYPHQAKDPIVLASAIITRLQTIVSRESNPFDPAVVTVGSFHAGAKHNIIPESAKLELTVRSYSDASRKLLLDAIARIVKGEAVTAGIPKDRMPVVTVKEPYTRSTYNSPDLAEEFAAHMRAELGGNRVMLAPPSMAGEDFGEYRRADEASIKSLIFWVGGVPPEQLEAAAQGGPPIPALHSPFWAPEADKVIATAAEALTRTALRLMAKP
jgi:metal-dependent amidase/aminoacylase/carboxypeptidase family protein